MPGRYALIVATDEYRDPKLNRLRTPAMDAAALAQVLGDPEIGDFEVQLAANEPDHLLRRRIAAFFGDRRRDDLLLLHFSCHGLKDDSGQLYFATADTEVAYLDASAIPAEFVSRQMAISRSSSVLMLLDCCYSGAIARGLRFRAGDQVDVEDHLGGHGRAIITASSAMEYAFEGDELTGEGRPSVFTAAVVKALETGEADRDQDRWISVRELYDYVCDEVREVTPHQRPNLLSHLEGELYVARSRYIATVALPAEILDALSNPISSVRVGAVTALEELVRGPDRALAAAARDQLEIVAGTDDSRRVTGAARAALAATGTPPPSTLPPFEAVEPPAPALHEDAGAPTPVAAWDALAAGTAPPPPAAARVEEPPPAAPERPPIRTGGPARWLWPVALLALGGGLIAAGYWITAPSDYSPHAAIENWGLHGKRKTLVDLQPVAGIWCSLIALLLAWRPKLTAAPWLALSALIVAAGAEGVINGLSRVEGDHGSDVTFYGSVLACVGAGVLYARLTAPPPDQRPGLLVSVLGAIILGVPLAIGVSELDSESGHPERWISLGLVIVAVAVLGAATLTRWRGRFPALLMVVSGAAACGFVVFDLWGFKDVIAFVGALLVLAGGLLAAGLPRSQAV